MTAQEMLNKRKFNTNEPISLSESDVEYLMNEFARHIAELAKEKELEVYSTPLRVIYFNAIISRIKKLTNDK